MGIICGLWLVEIATSGPSPALRFLPLQEMRNSLKVPASDEKLQYVVGIRKPWRSPRRHESIQKTL
jgi:hypothetical protein